ncbi:MAG: Mur ligase domain-containing protein [Candidatus Adiutrix sp.]|jgi:UDP-N-acetylmuramate: L-alanyl-gamma-D-glutamyl-meso-diaminopimelate ligase|nr:Mur ligase domain-containing protein [Candidatus Adiutrix sp.]
MFELDPKLNKPPEAFFRKAPAETYVHLIGIGGVAMTALAGLLKDAGYQVSGSDAGLYPPMSDILKTLGARLFEGYGPETLPEECDLAVVGNVVTREFPVLARLKGLGLRYLSLPQTLNALFMNRSRNLVVAGCHGKTSATAMAAKIWATGGLKPGFLIGGASLDFPKPWRLAAGDWFIVEGDEYDSAFFDKVPKFVHYRPHTVILTSVEFDHADIYPNLDAVTAAFVRLMKLIPPDGRLIAWGDDGLTRRIAGEAGVRPEFYGLGEDNDWRLVSVAAEGLSVNFELTGPGAFQARLSLNRPGVYNALNAAAAAAAFVGSGGEPRALQPALASFKGVKRRQEHLGVFGGIDLVDDFAHHPTAVAKTLEALRLSYPGRRLTAAFEPRSNTSRRAVFQKDYARALALADRVFLRLPSDPLKAPEGDRLDGRRLADDLGRRASLFENGLALGAALVHEAAPGDIVVVMSNGAFDGLTEHLKANLGRAHD